VSRKLTGAASESVLDVVVLAFVVSCYSLLWKLELYCRFLNMILVASFLLCSSPF
jgi:hypothetical protein